MSLKNKIEPELPVSGEPPGTDAEFVRQLREGDDGAGQQFVQEYYPGIYRYLLYLAGNRDSAEDLTQETFVQAWRRLETFNSRGTLRAWLHRIAHREFLLFIPVSRIRRLWSRLAIPASFIAGVATSNRTPQEFAPP